VLRSLIWWLMKVQARRKGRRDGREGIPTLVEAAGPDGELTHPHGEFRYKEAGDRHLRQISTRWQQRDRRLKEEYCATLAELRAAEKARDTVGEDVRERDTTHKQNVGEVEKERSAKRAAHGIEVGWRLAPAAYGLFMLGLFVGEIPLNAIAFRIFQESEVLNFVMTLALAVALVGGAHQLGVLLRIDRKSPTEAMLTTASFVIPLGALIAIALVRQGFLSAQALEAIREAQGRGQQPPIQPISPAMATVVFVLINLLIYSIAAILSYFSHDPLAKEIQRTERPVREARGRLATAEGGIAVLQVRLNRFAATREKVFAQTVEEAHWARNQYEELFQEYRGANMEARSDKTSPRVFGRKLEIKLPEVLGQIDWDCGTPGYLAAPSGRATSQAPGQG